MAVGDAIIGHFAATGNFQPAAGVEVLLERLSLCAAADAFYLFDGANTALILTTTSVGADGLKVPINNTIYLRFVLTTLLGYYAGYQIK